MPHDDFSFARLSEAHLNEIARSLRQRSVSGDRTAAAVADAVESVVRRRCSAQASRFRPTAARVGLEALRRVTSWVAARPQF